MNVALRPRERVVPFISGGGTSLARGAEIELTGVGKSFGAKQVLQALDLHVAAGQFVAIVGQSGCGKSTLLRILSGLDRPSEGRLSLRHADGAGQASARMMFQESRLLPWARVAANVEIGVGTDLPPAARRAAALEALGEVGLAARARDWPSILSGGQKQRVALARALVSKPDLLLLDEPLGALDALTRIEMQALVERVWQHAGFTAVLVTHDVAEAVTLGDRIIVLEDGRTTEDLLVELPRPRHRGAADFASVEGRVLDRLLGAATEAAR